MRIKHEISHRYFVALFYIVLAFNLYSGNNTTGGTPDVSTFMKSRTDLFPHSPEAESLGKYGMIPMNLYSGLPEISIPIYTIKTQGLSIPITLQYNYNGCKPNEMSTSIGLGWSLSGTGTITKLIRGQLDENFGETSGFDSYCNLSILSTNQGILSSIANKSFDGAPDEYIFNVANYSGRFIIFKGKAYIDKYPNIEIKPLIISGTIASFILTDENGNKYFFEDKEISHGKDIITYTSDWQLSRIITADKQDTIVYNYLQYTYRQPRSVTDSYSVTRSDCLPTTVDQGTPSVGTFDGNYVEARQLSSINYKNGSVNFNLTKDREDLPESTGAKMMDKINITSAFTDSKRTVFLNQNYFGKKSRLKLNSIFFEDERKSYYFSYNDGDFPYADTRGIDLFGYYNGKITNGNLFPKDFFQTSSILSYADRGCYPTYSSLGCIKSIVYPSGGYSTFEWEQNKAGHIPSPQPKLQKLAISPSYNSYVAVNNVSSETGRFKIERDQIVKVITARRAASANKYEIPLVQILQGNKVIYTSPNLTFPDDQIIDSLSLKKGEYTLKVMTNNTMSGVLGEVDYFAMVTDMKDITDGPGLRIKNISDYENISSLSPSRTESYSYNDGISQFKSAIKTLGSEKRGNSGSTNTTAYYASIRSALSDYDSQLFYYGNVTKYIHKTDGDLKSDYTYCNSPYINDIKLSASNDYTLRDNDYSPLSSKKYKYNYILSNTWYTFSAYKSVSLGGACNSTNTEWTMSLSSPDAANPRCVSEIYSVSDQGCFNTSYALINQESTIVYNQNGENGVSIVTDYEYDNPNHYLPTKISSTNSIGEKTIVVNKYPYDYDFSGGNTPYIINTLYKKDTEKAVNDYNTGRSNLMSQIQQYGSYCTTTPENKNIIDRIVSTAHFFNDFSVASTNAVVSRENRFSEMNQLLDEKITSTSVASQKAILFMQRNNIKSSVIEKTTSVEKGDGNTYLVSSVRNNYNVIGGAIVLEKQEQTEIQSGTLYSSFNSNRNNYYKVKKTFLYDNKLRVKTEINSDNLPINYVWGYGQQYPVAVLAGGDYSVIEKTINQNKVNGLSVDQTDLLNKELDKLRTIFADSLVLVYTYSYNPLYDVMTSFKSPHNISTYYTYDNLGRLEKVLNNDKNIEKEYTYHYMHAYFNNTQSKVFTKNDCTECSTGLPSTYVVSANKYMSYLSQNDADRKALEDIELNGQAYANAQGACTSTCIASDTRRCINGVCETGVKVYIDSYPTPNGYVGQYTCVYVYEFSDGSTSAQFSEIVKGKPCTISLPH